MNMDREMQLLQIINHCHQCYQLLMLDQTIDAEEFALRLDTDTVDYRQVMTDYKDLLDQQDYNCSGLYIQRIVDILYPAGE